MPVRPTPSITSRSAPTPTRKAPRSRNASISQRCANRSPNSASVAGTAWQRDSRHLLFRFPRTESHRNPCEIIVSCSRRVALRRVSPPPLLRLQAGVSPPRAADAADGSSVAVQTVRLQRANLAQPVRGYGIVAASATNVTTLDLPYVARIMQIARAGRADRDARHATRGRAGRSGCGAGGGPGEECRDARAGRARANTIAIRQGTRHAVATRGGKEGPAGRTAGACRAGPDGRERRQQDDHGAARRRCASGLRRPGRSGAGRRGNPATGRSQQRRGRAGERRCSASSRRTRRDPYRRCRDLAGPVEPRWRMRRWQAAW